MFARKLNFRTVFIVVVALIVTLAHPTEASGKWKKHGWRWMKPCSGGWWQRVRESREVNDDNRAVLRCLLSNCGEELKRCAHSKTCRKTTRCLSDCRDDGRECAFDCLKKYDGISDDAVKYLGKCAIGSECMQSP